MQEADKGLELYFAGKKSESLTYFQRAVRFRGKAEDFHWLGVNLSDLGRYEEALLFLTKALERGGAAAPWATWHWLGSTHCKAGRYEEALLHLKQARAVLHPSVMKPTPEITKLLRVNDRWMAEALVHLGRYSEALPYIEEEVKRGDATDPKWFLECFRRYRQCLEELGRLTQPPASKEENKHWKRASTRGTIERYVRFLAEYPGGTQAPAAVMKIEALVANQERFRMALTEVLPAGAAEDVSFTPAGFLRRGPGYELRMTTHLLPHHSATETDPRVKGAYGSREALERCAKERMVEIYRVVFTSSEIKLMDVTNVTIECHHGVHISVYRDLPSTAFDSARCIYTTSISTKEAAKHDWKNISSEEVTRMWKTKYNEIPSLTFK
jgi:hypothetical protein